MQKIIIEEVISKNLTGVKQEIALDFVAYIRALGLKINVIDVNKKAHHFTIENNGVAFFRVYINNSFSVSPFPGVSCSWFYSSANESDVKFPVPVVDDQIKKLVWKKVKRCLNCGCKFAPGRKETILGKEFDNVCVSPPIQFCNISNPVHLVCIKQMVTAMKNDIFAEKFIFTEENQS